MTRPLGIQGLERLDGAAAVAELAVVVVLDDGRVVALGPGQQGQAPGQGHGHPQRELVRGGDVDQPGARRDGLDDQADVDLHPVRVPRLALPTWTGRTRSNPSLPTWCSRRRGGAACRS